MDDIAVTILKKIFANREIYWCMGERDHVNMFSAECFITIDGSTPITKEELDFLGEVARTAIPDGS